LQITILCITPTCWLECEVNNYSLRIKCVVATQVTYVDACVSARELAEGKESVRYAGSRSPARISSRGASGRRAKGRMHPKPVRLNFCAVSDLRVCGSVLKGPGSESAPEDQWH